MQSTDTLTEHTCGECGIRFAMPKRFYEALQQTGNYFYCPNGHTRHFIVGESEETKAKKKVQRLEARLAAADERTTYWRNEASKYKCPHCSRALKTAASLIRHLGSIHSIPAAEAKRLTAKAGPDAYNTKIG